ncbi:MAG TPA: hypothetical protein VGX70_11150 [Gemmataceae bacterium]|jgi:hypothetical protein|nr:hypothetical protein [Gemmataceae bacterium]
MNKNAAVRPNQSVPLGEVVQQIRSRTDFAAFVGALLVDLKDRSDEWENLDLGTFLQAIKGWVEDMEGYYQNVGEAVPDQPSWKTFGQILLAAKVYE